MIIVPRKKTLPGLILPFLQTYKNIQIISKKFGNFYLLNKYKIINIKKMNK